MRLDVKDMKQRGRAGALATCVVWTLTLMALLGVASAIEGAALDAGSDRARALLRIALAVAAETLLLVVILLRARRRGEKAFEHSFFSPGRAGGWVLGLAVWLLWCLPLLLNPPEGSPVLDASLFNLAGSLAAGPGAGAVEEALFRGAYIAVLARGGWGTAGQLLLSSLLFGITHAGWGVAGGNVMALLFPVVGTTVLGLLFGLVYVASGRRLLPAIATHAALNLVIEPWLVLAAVEGNLVLPTG